MNAELHPPRRARRGNQEALIAWLDEQERILRMRGVPAELVQEFDPIHNLPEPPEVEEGRRTLEIKFDRFGGLNLESSIADQINRSIEERVRSRFKLEITSWIQLQNIEDGSMMDWYNTDLGESPWFETLVASRDWVSRQEEARLANPNRPNTKWSYELTKAVYVKVILDRHPLFLGLGRLPDWLRNKHGVLSLDTYEDNLCLFRCIAVHWGATPKRNMRKTRELEKSFFTQRPGLRNRLTDKHLSLLENHFKQGIAAYTVQPNGDFILTHVPANYDQVGRPLLNMGLYDGHAFLITDLKQVAGTYTCGECQARFTKCGLPHRVTSDTKLREFQYKLLNRYLVTNVFLNKIGVLPSPACSFCGKEDESLEHILISCNYAKEFWAEVIKWLCNLKVNINNLNNREILFGMSNCEDEIFINHVLLVAKQYLYSCRCKSTFPLIKVFKARLRKIETLELEVAKSKNKLPNYTAKWGKFLKNIDL